MLEPILGVIGLGVAVFVSTDMDDLFVLAAFFADPAYHARDIVIGQFVGMAVLYAMGVIGSLLSLAVPVAYVGSLGVVPILIGARKLWQLRAGRDGPEAGRSELARGWDASGQALSVAAVTLANGADNLGTYVPLFASHSGREITLLGIVFAVMIVVWCSVAHFLVSHPVLRTPIRRYGHRLVPFVLIAIGLLILSHAGTYDLLAEWLQRIQ